MQGKPLGTVTFVAVVYVLLWGGAAVLSPFIDVPWVDWEQKTGMYASLGALVIALILVARTFFGAKKT